MKWNLTPENWASVRRAAIYHAGSFLIAFLVTWNHGLTETAPLLSVVVAAVATYVRKQVEEHKDAP
jgi:hypothetical protein